MIRSFASSDTRLLFETGQSKELPPDILRRALRKLELIDNAMTLLDLRLPPGNRLHAFAFASLTTACTTSRFATITEEGSWMTR